jgi:hypothetical protein
MQSAGNEFLEYIYFVNNNTGWTLGYNIYKTNNGGVTHTSNKNEYIPSNYKLHQNYPNPFNPVTKIKYEIPTSTFVKLLVYDITGKYIETLVNKDQKAGTYEVEWNAENYTSGAYFYKLETNNYSESKRMLVIK